MAQEEQDRSEAPTSFKLDRARKKGQVARGTDLSFLTGLVAFIAYAWVAGTDATMTLATAMRDALVTGMALADDPGSVFTVTSLLAGRIQRPLFELAILLLGVVLLFELLQTGFVFSADPLKPDLSRLNLAQGLKKLFTVRLLIETAKNVAKMGVYVGCGLLVLRAAMASDFAAATDGGRLARAIVRVGSRLLLVFAGVALLFTVVDQIIARRGYLKRMRMSRREVKRESRDREGEPRLKQKRKQLHGEFVSGQRSIRGLRGADVLVANPTHIAVALRYDPITMTAPTIVSLGADRLALKLRRLALAYGVAVVENRVLARSLLQSGVLGREVPPECYGLVADVYNGLRRQPGNGD